MERPKEILTTGDVARICRVAPRTVSKWFDSGQLRGYRIPGSRDRRIPLQHLVRFMKIHGMPLDTIETGQTRVLIVESSGELGSLVQQALEETGQYQVQIADTGFKAGAMVEQFKPHLLLIDLDVPGIDPRSVARYLSSQEELFGAQLLAMSASLTPTDNHLLRQQGFHGAIAKPFNLRQLISTIDQLLGLPV